MSSAAGPATGPTLGLRVPPELFHDTRALRTFLSHVDASPLERVCIGDHVTFREGIGFDGLQLATATAALTDRVTIETAVYLLPLRHPVPVARQISSLAALAPGRFAFGVGVGGEDRNEVLACGVDPTTRGRRLDESLDILSELLAGRSVSRTGGHFELDEVRVLPAPAIRVPFLVGGRSDAALRRAGRLGDGWIAVWVSPRRFAEGCAEVQRCAHEAGRDVERWEHSMHVWCGFGPHRAAARAELAGQMESLYGVPFERFERYCPYGSPDEVAAAIRPYLEVGCTSVNLIATAPSAREAADGAVRVRALLRGET
jgi:alkanesulfonate monooxygenase SsuD/methylene tetrahydromethanopterin reductase-like flavin-dependent oxidoreductase (luciferase family)